MNNGCRWWRLDDLEIAPSCCASPDVGLHVQGFSFLLGGYETTASALGFTIYNLSANPDKAAKLAQVHCALCLPIYNHPDPLCDGLASQQYLMKPL